MKDPNPVENFDEKRRKDFQDFNKVGTIAIDNLIIQIENPAYTERCGIDSSGKPWKVTMKCNYGYFVGTDNAGTDNQAVDVFVGNTLESKTIYIVKQIDPYLGVFDELKVMLGFPTMQAAKDMYLANYCEGWQGFGGIIGISLDSFKKWLEMASRNKQVEVWNDAFNSTNICNDCGSDFLAGDTCPECGSDDFSAVMLDKKLSDKEKAALPSDKKGGDEDHPWPLEDPGHVHSALAYYNGGKGKQNLSSQQWAALGKKIMAAARKFFHNKYRLVNGKIENLGDITKPEAKMDEVIETRAIVDRFENEDDILHGANDHEWMIVMDAKTPEGLMKVKQLAMLIEPNINDNGRLYTKKAFNDARAEVNERAHAGAILTELRHPEVVKSKNGNVAFIDNHDRKVSRITHVHEATNNGEVWIDRLILDTAPGRKVAQSFRNKKPFGLSTRALVQGVHKNINGKHVFVADQMTIPTWDDMDETDRPAVLATRDNYHLITDELRAELKADLSVENENSQEPVIDEFKEAEAIKTAKEIKPMNQILQKQLNTYKLAVAGGKGKAVIDKARNAVLDSLDAEFSDEGFAAFQAVKDMETEMAPKGLPGNQDSTLTEGDQTGDGKGGASRLETEVNANHPSDTDADMKTKAPAFPGGDVAQDELKELLNERKTQKTEALRQKAVKDAVESLSETILVGVPAEEAQAIKDSILSSAKDADAVKAMLTSALDMYSKLSAKNKLAEKGVDVENLNKFNNTETTGIRKQMPAYWPHVQSLLDSVDKQARSGLLKNAPNPDADDVKARREWNKQNVIFPIIDQIEQKRQEHKTVKGFMAAMDSCMTTGEQELVGKFQAMGDAANGRGTAALDTSTTANFYNQPTVSVAMLVQMFQDLTALQIVDAIGPGAERPEGEWANVGNDYSAGNTGWILRIPTETYTTPGGSATIYTQSGINSFGNTDFGTYDAGMLNPEGAGIPEGQVDVVWLSYATLPRSVAISLSRELRAEAGLGPLNWDAIGRHLYHITYDKNRRIDTALYNDMLYTSDNYQAVTITSEVQDLTNNSVYAAGGSVTVNLNPAKTANAAIAYSGGVALDPFITYGLNVVAAVRLKAGGSLYTNGVYAGGPYGLTPVLLPKNVYNINTAGQNTITVANPITVTVGGTAVVQGPFDTNRSVQTYPQTYGQTSAPGTGTYAVESEYGVLIFTSASGVTGTGTLVTSPVVASYSYVTNFDNFVAKNPVLGAGITYQNYLSGLVAQVDNTAALMASQPRLNAPNLYISNFNASTYVTQAQIFAPLFQPKGTALYDTPDTFASRNGINFFRHNSPWLVGSHRALISKRRSTKYGVGIPAQVTGPYPKFDPVTLGITANDTFYLQEYSTIATPQVADQNGNIYNPVSRSIVFRSPNG